MHVVHSVGFRLVLVLGISTLHDTQVRFEVVNITYYPWYRDYVLFKANLAQ